MSGPGAGSRVTAQGFSVEGRRVVVVGAARSGIAAAELLAGRGALVTLSESRASVPECEPLRARGVALELGGHQAATFAGAELIVTSPGVPLEQPAFDAARARGVEVIGELELAWRWAQGRVIAITGTKGKSTTTTLVGRILRAAGMDVTVGGNIGVPFSSLVEASTAETVHVIEASSFQLETTDAFHPRVAAVLNVTPDHLDRHGSLAAYADAKARIFTNQTPADCAVLNADDDGARALASRTRADVLWFSRLRRLDHGVFVHEGRITAKLNGHYEDIGPVSDIALRGAHNVENVLAATACALWTGMAPATIRRGIAQFRAVTHRIEPVRDVAGVRFYNDSKATNVDSTIKALESFTEPVVLIAGGKGKGQDFAPLAAVARGRVAHVVVIGEDGPKIGRVMADAGIPVTAAGSMDDAIRTAQRLASPGAVVLLSPACASFDMFDNFEHRGDVFKKLVERLD